MRYFRKIVGQRVYLSPVNEDDAKIYTKWLNDYSVSGNLGNYRQMISLAVERETLHHMTSAGQNYAIVLCENDTLIGNVSLMEIDNVNRVATAGMFIGEPENRNKGYGSEALRLILHYGFNTLNLHNIMLLVHSDNEQGIACYKKAGFREFGRRREAKYKDGAYVDVVYMEILEEDIKSKPGC